MKIMTSSFLKLFFVLLVSGVLPLTAGQSADQTVLQAVMTQITGSKIPLEITECIACYANNHVFACGFVFHDSKEKDSKMVLFNDFDLVSTLSKAETHRDRLLCVVGVDYDKQLHYLVKEAVGSLHATARNSIDKAFHPANQGIWFESDTANYLRSSVPDGVDLDLFAAECAQKIQAQKEPYTLQQLLRRSDSNWRSPLRKKNGTTRLDSLVTAVNRVGMPTEVQTIIHSYLDEETVRKEFFCALRPPAAAMLMWTHSFARNGALAGLPADRHRLDAVSEARHSASWQLILRDIVGPIDDRYRQDLVAIARAFGKTQRLESAASRYLRERVESQENACSIQ